MKSWNNENIILYTYRHYVNFIEVKIQVKNSGIGYFNI